MGQYHMLVNLTKKEFIEPHSLGAGLKLWEQMANDIGPGKALIVLLAVSSGPEGRGGGDFRGGDPDNLIGRWACDRIAIVGDYAEDSDIPEEYWPKRADGRAISPKEIFNECRQARDVGPDKYYKELGEFTDITPLVATFIERFLDGKFAGDGWKQWTWNNSNPINPEQTVTVHARPDIIIATKK